MRKIVPVVEGPGELDAVPELIRKVLREYQKSDVAVAHPKNAHGVGGLTVAGGLERFLRYALNEPGVSGVLILRDADNECPYDLAQDLATRARALNAPVPVAVVVAKCEYEAWFLASIETIAGLDLDGRPGISGGTTCQDPEAQGDAKGWITRAMPGSRAYKETFDQLAMTRLLDIGVAHRNSRSFRRFCKAVVELCSAFDRGTSDVTPASSRQE